MKKLVQGVQSSPALIRACPFLVFIALTFCQGYFGPAAKYWFYLAKTLVGAWFIWLMRPSVAEMRWKVTWEAAVTGVAVFVVWVGIDGRYPSLNELLSKVGMGQATDAAEKAAATWNPHGEFGQGTGLAWCFIGLRILGSSLVVPPLEEVFFRSLVYRYIANPDFMRVAVGQFAWLPFVLTSLIFGFEHEQWLAGILCGFIYQGLVCWKKRLDDAIAAHALTNFLLGLYVGWRGAWQFW